MAYSRKRRFFFALALASALTAGVASRAQSPSPTDAAAPKPAKPNVRRARKAYERGLRAEQAGDWPAALAAYTEAVESAPEETQYLLRQSAVRFQIVQQHSDRAERYALAGQLDRATEELRAALKLDPTYSVARERLAQFEATAKRQALPAPAPAQARAIAAGGLVELQPRPGQHDFHYRGDTRGAYEEIARQFGVTASFDADLPARQVRFRVTGVDFTMAMRLLGQETATFWRALDVHTFFVAADTPEKRREYAPEVTRMIVLPASATPERMTETVRLVREIAGITRTELNTATHTITLRDTPENVALAAAIVEQLEQAPADLMLEIEILEVNRSYARRLGIAAPSTAQILTISTADIRAAQQATTLSALLAIIQRVFGTTVPALIAIGGGQTRFLLTLPGGAADFSSTLNLVRSGRRMLLRAEDGQPATFFIGERFPVALATLSASLESGTLNPGAVQVAFPRSDFAVGTNPLGIVTADFNGDGKPDLAVANKGSNNVSIVLGNGDGTFSAHTDFTTGKGPVALATGDFNGDGKLDLAVVNQTDNTVSILLGNGDGTFGAKTDFPTGLQPSAIAVADFDGDGHLDLAVANQADNTVSILLGKGDGTFNPRKDFTTGKSPVSVATGDFNADTKRDLAVANQGDNTVSILLGKGDGTFNAKTDFATGASPAAVLVADFNGDARPDLAVANQADNTVSILLGNGDGTFAAKRDTNVGTSPVALAAADFNADSKLDLAIANQGSNTATLLVGNGDGTFLVRIDVSLGGAPSGLVAADFNNDARPDLASANRDSNSVTVIINTSAFFPQQNVAQTAFPGVEFEDIGLKVRATPRIHTDGEVTLHMQFEIRDLAGTSINGIPIISNRTIEQTVRLRENESTILSGIVEQQESKTITGLPGLATLPGVGYLAGRRDTQKSDTELLIVVTPRRLQLGPHEGRPIYAGRGEGAPTAGGGRRGTP